MDKMSMPRIFLILTCGQDRRPVRQGIVPSKARLCVICIKKSPVRIGQGFYFFCLYACATTEAEKLSCIWLMDSLSSPSL